MENTIQFFDEIDLRQKQNQLRLQSFQGLFKYPDGTHSIIYEKSQSPEIGNSINTYNFQLLSITKIISSRPHKGIYNDESKRQMISIVEGVPFTFEQIKTN